MLNKPFLSIQELLEKTETQRREIRDAMDSAGHYHPDDASLFDGQKAEDRHLITDALRNIPLKEFLGRGTTLGDYLVAGKVYDDLIMYSQVTDKIDAISAHVLNGWEGANLDVIVADKEGYIGQRGASGAIMGTTTVSGGKGGTMVKCALSPILLTINARITSDLIDDAIQGKQGDLLEFHIRNAAMVMGEMATEQAIDVLVAPPDCIGTVNTGTTTSSGITKWTDTDGSIEDGIRKLGDCGWWANTILITGEAWAHSVVSTITAGWTGTIAPAKQNPFDAVIGYLNVIFSRYRTLGTVTTAAPPVWTLCKTMVFDQKNALLTGRKRWMQIENYSDPVRDLAGAVVTSRQDTVSLFKDAIYVLTEKA
jgi:hypothetical protein